MGFPLGFSGSTAVKHADPKHVLAAVADEIQRLKCNVEWRSESEFSFNVPMLNMSVGYSWKDALVPVSSGRIWLERDGGSKVRLGYDLSYLRTTVVLAILLVIVLPRIVFPDWGAGDIGWIMGLALVVILLFNYLNARFIWPRFIRKAIRGGAPIRIPNER